MSTSNQKQLFNLVSSYQQNTSTSGALDFNQILYQLQTSYFLQKVNTKVYFNRISLEYEAVLSLWQHRETYSAMDIGHIFINKGRYKASVGAYSLSSDAKLFEIFNLPLSKAEELKDALDLMLSFRYYYLGNSSR